MQKSAPKLAAIEIAGAATNRREIAEGALVPLSASRSLAPVFVLGAPRSGTTLLYHMLLSAGSFAVYRAESEVFHMIEPRFGDLSVQKNRQRLLAAWFKSPLFTKTGLTEELLRRKITAECRNGGDFLRIVMNEMAQHQGVQRWAECTPDHILYLPRIKETIPNALVIHIIRDGRDVALSMEKQGWPRQLPWDGNPGRMAAGLYWEWMIARGRKDGGKLGSDYIEVRYENIVSDPRTVLQRLSTFIDQGLDYDEIQRVAIGSVSQPNTSFKEESGSFVGRWKTFYSPEELSMFEALVGAGLQEFGYDRASAASPNLRMSAFRTQYRSLFEMKLLLKTKTPLGRLLVTSDLSKM